MVLIDAEKAKDEGNTLLANGDIDGAIEKYSTAISLDPGNHIYFSNRSAAHMRNGMYTMALADARQCIQLSPSWAKGHSRAAAAYSAIGDPNAAAAYAEARRLGGTYDAANASTTADSTDGRSVDTMSFVDMTLMGLRLFFVVNAFVFMLPGVGDDRSFVRAMLAVLTCYAGELYRDYRNLIGRPFEEILQKLPTDWRVQYAMVALLFLLAGNRRTVFLLPHILCTVGHLADMVIRLQPGVAMRLYSLLSIDLLLARFTQKGAERWTALSMPQKWSTYNEAVLAYAGIFEVSLLFCMIFELFTPSRSFLVIFLYSNILKIRYLTSVHVQRAFHAVDSQLLSLCGRVPIVLNVYMKVRSYCANQVKVPTEDGARQQGGFMGNLQNSIKSCTIM